MTKNTFALILIGGAAIASASLGLAACSSDTGTNPLPPGPDGSTNNDTGSQADTSMPMGDSGNTPDSGCTHGAVPKLHPSSGDAGSLFCGYPADGGGVYCDPKTQVCCVGGTQGGGFADPTCNAPGTACSNGSMPHELDCEDPVDCQVAGAVCCLSGETPALDTSCNYYYAKSKIATKCILPDAGGMCATGDIQLCTADTECPMGKTCTPFKSIVFSLGFCM